MDYTSHAHTQIGCDTVCGAMSRIRFTLCRTFLVLAASPGDVYSPLSVVQPLIVNMAVTGGECVAGCRGIRLFSRLQEVKLSAEWERMSEEASRVLIKTCGKHFG